MAFISVVTAYNNKEEMTIDFLDNLEDKMPENSELILVNAGSKPIKHPLISKRIDLRENKSFSNSMNHGIREAKGDYICIIGNDTFPQTADWLDSLIKGFKKGVGIVSPTHDKPGLTAFDRFIIKDDGRYIEMNMFPAICWVISRKVIEEVGLFDERFLIGTYEDNDYILRLQKKHLKLVVDKEVMVKHLLSQTMNQYDVAAIMNDNLVKLQEKWGAE